MANEHLTAARMTLAAALAEAVECHGDPCVHPLCPVHAGTERERLRAAAWEPAAGAEPWASLEAGTLDLASIIDHTILRPDATPADIEAGCREARELRCAAFCSNLVHVPAVARLLAGSAVRICTVVGFPLGATPTALKAEETRWAVSHGATEIDMVVSVGMLKSGHHAEVLEDIRSVVAVARESNADCKVILETALLTPAEKIVACLLACRAGAAYVKTSTGYSKSGATPGDVALMRLVVDDALGVKAAGGIRTRDQALAMVRSGASRIGTSASPAIARPQPTTEGP